MPISFPCPACGRILEAPDSAAGATGSCKFCQARISAPVTNGQAATLVSQPSQAAAGPLLTPPSAPPPAPGYGAIPPMDANTATSESPVGYAPPPRAAIAYGQPNYALIGLMWILTAAYWGPRLAGMPFSGIMWLANVGALVIAASLRRSASTADRWNGTARYIFALVIVVLSIALHLEFGA